MHKQQGAAHSSTGAAQPRTPSARLPHTVRVTVTRRSTGETMGMTVMRGAFYDALPRRIQLQRDLDALLAAWESKHPDLTCTATS